MGYIRISQAGLPFEFKVGTPFGWYNYSRTPQAPESNTYHASPSRCQMAHAVDYGLREKVTMLWDGPTPILYLRFLESYNCKWLGPQAPKIHTYRSRANLKCRGTPLFTESNLNRKRRSIDMFSCKIRI